MQTIKESLKELKKLEDTGHAFALFSRDGKKIVLADRREVCIWDADLEKALKQLELASDISCPVAFSPDGKKIVTAEEGGTVSVRDAESGKELKKLAKITEHIVYTSFLPDGKKVVTVNRDENMENTILRIWDADSGKELQRLGSTMAGNAFTFTALTEYPFFSSDGKRVILVSSEGDDRNNAVRIVDWERLPPLRVPAIEDF